MSEEVSARSRRVSRTIYCLLAAAVFFSDQITKKLIEDSIHRYSVVTVIPGFFNLIHTSNSGVAFSLFSNSPSGWKTVALILLSLVLLVAVVVIVGRTRNLDWRSGVGLALIVGGALSNLADRIRFGSVVDFLDLYVGRYHWPTFNLADSAIVVGAGFLILHVLMND